MTPSGIVGAMVAGDGTSRGSILSNCKMIGLLDIIDTKSVQFVSIIEVNDSSSLYLISIRVSPS